MTLKSFMSSPICQERAVIMNRHYIAFYAPCLFVVVFAIIVYCSANTQTVSRTVRVVTNRVAIHRIYRARIYRVYSSSLAFRASDEFTSGNGFSFFLFFFLNYIREQMFSSDLRVVRATPETTGL